MIKVKDGEVHISGDIPKLFIDLVLILHSFMEMVEDELNRKDAEKLLVLAGKLAILNADDLESKFAEIVEDFQNDTRI